MHLMSGQLILLVNLLRLILFMFVETSADNFGYSGGCVPTVATDY